MDSRSGSLISVQTTQSPGRTCHACCSLFQLEEAKQLVRDAIAAGIFCDLGSGSNVDLCVITEAGPQYLRGYDKPTEKGKR